MDDELKMVKMAAFFDELNKMEELSKEAEAKSSRLGLGRGPRNGTGQGPRDGSGPRCSGGDVPKAVRPRRKINTTKMIGLANRLRRL